MGGGGATGAVGEKERVGAAVSSPPPRSCRPPVAAAASGPVSLRGGGGQGDPCAKCTLGEVSVSPKREEVRPVHLSPPREKHGAEVLFTRR